MSNIKKSWQDKARNAVKALSALPPSFVEINPSNPKPISRRDWPASSANLREKSGAPSASG